jgi:hypothetical protein
MAFGLLSWWHSGEEDATKVFRKGWRRVGTLVIIALVSGCLLPILKNLRWTPRLLFGYGCGLAFIISRVLAERRRAVILSTSAIKYRPPFGPPRIIRVDDICKVSRANVLVSFGWKARLKQGAKFLLRDGNEVGIPLDFPGADEILRDIELAVTRNPSR